MSAAFEGSGSLLAHIAREAEEEAQYALDKGRKSAATPNGSELQSPLQPQPAPSPGLDHVLSMSESALPFADAGLRGAGAIFLTKYGRGRVSETGASKTSDWSRSVFHAVHCISKNGLRLRR
jgi:hypothetical protein